MADKLHVLLRPHVLAVVDLAQIKRLAVLIKHILSTREGLLLASASNGNLPGKQPVGDRHDSVHFTTIVVPFRHREGEHRRIPRRDVVGKRQSLHDLLGSNVPTLYRAISVERKEVAVAARDVAGARDVAEHENVLRLRDDRLEVATAAGGSNLW